MGYILKISVFLPILKIEQNWKLPIYERKMSISINSGFLSHVLSISSSLNEWFCVKVEFKVENYRFWEIPVGSVWSVSLDGKYKN